MIDIKIRKELLRLATVQLEATIEANYYNTQMSQLLTEALENSQQLNVTPNFETLSMEECLKLSKGARVLTVEGRACQEIVSLVRRLADKAKRKANEAEQRINALCKRHGIDNLDEYLKAEMQKKEEQKS